jgi:hypothetical protein
VRSEKRDASKAASSARMLIGLENNRDDDALR